MLSSSLRMMVLIMSLKIPVILSGIAVWYGALELDALHPLPHVPWALPGFLLWMAIVAYAVYAIISRHDSKH